MVKTQQTDIQTPNCCRIHIIIVAGGSGSRFSSTIPKQYCLLSGKPVLMHTIEAMRRAVPDAELCVVISEKMHGLWRELCTEHAFDSPRIVYGGETRWHSVRNALDTLEVYDGDIVLVHDGARPLTDSELISRVVRHTLEHDAAVPATPVTDSLRRISETELSEAVDRSRYRAVQTPQGFNARKLIAAYALPYSTTFTDDASVFEANGGVITLCEGATDNIKITNSGDIEIAELLLNRRTRQKDL